MKKILLFILIYLTGCAVPIKDLTQEEFAELTTRVYENTSSEQALDSAAKIISDLSPDVQISHKADRLFAERLNFHSFLVIFFGRDNYYYDFKVDESLDDKVQVRIIMYERHTAGAYEPAREKIIDPSDYHLFWKRLDYYLGRSDTWYTCEDYIKLMKESLVPRGNLLGMCDYVKEK